MTKAERTLRADGIATRSRIIAVAGECFAAKGYAEATSKEIAGLAQVDLASINYHFGSRSGLYSAVLAEAHRRLVDRRDLELLVARPIPATDKLRNLIAFVISGGSGAEQWPLMVLGRELLAPSSHLVPLQQDEILPKIRLLLPVLSEITGIPADDPVLWRCLPCIAAPCALIVLAGWKSSPFASQIGQVSPDQLIDHLATFALGGLAAVGDSYRGGPGR